MIVSTARRGQTDNAAVALNFSLEASAITFADDWIICCLIGNSSSSIAPDSEFKSDGARAKEAEISPDGF